MSLILLDDAKAFVQIGGDANNALIQLFIDDAEDFVEEMLGISLTKKTVVDEFVLGGGFNMWVKSKPVLSVSKVFDNRTNTEVDVSQYKLINDRIARIDQCRWFESNEGYLIDYIGGYDGGVAAANVPAPIRTGILNLMYRGFHERGGKIKEKFGGSGGIEIDWSDFVDSAFWLKLRRFARGQSIL